MPRDNPHRTFAPDPDQMARAPAVSGNTINGLGETEPRRPKVVYWAPDPEDIPHGQMQRWFYTVDPGDERFGAARRERMAMLSAPLPDVEGPAVQRRSQEWTEALERYVENGACDKIGVAEMQPEWVFEGRHIPQSRVIVVGVQHDYTAISKAPEPPAGVEVMVQYNRAISAALGISRWLRAQGWDADPVTGPMTGSLALIPPALACGFGELGKHGSIIDRDMGASFRLSAILTDAPFAPTPPEPHGIDAFCANCRICEDACPPDAIFPERQMVRGVRKWYVDFDACLPFFNQHQGCAICIAICPWSRPGIGPNLAEKLRRRSARKGD